MTQLRKNQTGEPTSNGGHFAKAAVRPEADLDLGDADQKLDALATASAEHHLGNLDAAISSGAVNGDTVRALAESGALDIIAAADIDITDTRVRRVAGDSAEDTIRFYDDLAALTGDRVLTSNLVVEIIVATGVEAIDRIANGMKFGADADSPLELGAGMTHIGRPGRALGEIISDKGRNIDWSADDSAMIKGTYKRTASSLDRELIETVFPVEAGEAYAEMAEDAEDQDYERQNAEH
jgi:hypothetical protein